MILSAYIYGKTIVIRIRNARNSYKHNYRAFYGGNLLVIVKKVLYTYEEMSSSAGDDENPSRIVHSLEHAESVDSMDTSETYNSDPELIINTGIVQLADSEMIVPFANREDDSEQRSVPTCSRDAEVEEFQPSRQDLVGEFHDKARVNSDANMNLEPKDMVIPKPGTPVSSKAVKKAGPYVLGPLIGSSPVQSIVQCLSRKEGTDKFYTIKILTLKDSMEQETQDDRQGKMLLHSEYSLLSLLQNQDGVVHHHGFFKVSKAYDKT